MRAPIGTSNYGSLFLHDDNDRAVGAKPHVVGSPLELLVLALDLRHKPGWDDARADEIIAHRRRSLLRKLEIGVFLADRVGVTEQPDIGVAALPLSDHLVEGSAALLVHPGLVEAEIHDVSARRVGGLIGHPDRHALAAE